MFSAPKVERHHPPASVRDRIAFGLAKMLRFLAHSFFSRRYGHRAIVLETVAAVPGMVGGALQHFRALRRMQSDNDRIRLLLGEAENERQHLMTFVQFARPTQFERLLVLCAQGIFFNCYFLLYLAAPGMAHRLVGYLKEEAVRGYTEYLAGVEDGTYANVAAPYSAIAYWNLPDDARLRDVIIAIRADKCRHRDLNHRLADQMA